MILILDDVLTRDQCLNTINKFSLHPDLIEKCPIINHEALDIADKIFSDTESQEILKNIINKVNSHFGGDYTCEWGKLYKWDQGRWQSYHLDVASSKTRLTSITYLNEDFANGCTVFADGTRIRPLEGRTLIFDGQLYYHGVEPVMGGTRYAIAIWYE
jgi:hypothetical protein